MKRLLCVVFFCAVGAVHASPAFTATWSSASGSTAMGSIADPQGNIAVNLSLTNGGSFLSGVRDSSTFGIFYNNKTAADLYDPDLPGTADFVSIASQSSWTLYTLTFSRAVENPVFHTYNLDYRNYSFLGGVTTTVLSGVNLVASGSVVGDNNGAENSSDMGYLMDKNRGNPNGSAYGSFQLNGTFASIQWTRPLVSDGYYSDGNSLGISIYASTPTPTTDVPEPSSLALVGLALGMGGTVSRHWRHQQRGRDAV